MKKTLDYYSSLKKKGDFQMSEEKKEKNGWPVFCVMDTSALFNYPDQVEILSKALTKKEFDGKKEVDGKIVISTVVEKEVNDYFYHSKLISKQRKIEKQYSELIQKRQAEKKAGIKKIHFWIGLKLNRQWAIDQALEDEKKDTKITELESEIKEMKDLSEGVKKAKALIDQELGSNPIWMLKRVTPEIMYAARRLQDEVELYQNKEGEKIKNPPLDSDLRILATAMQLSSQGFAFLVTHDSGLANAAMFVSREQGYKRVIAKPNALGPWFKKNNN